MVYCWFNLDNLLWEEAVDKTRIASFVLVMSGMLTLHYFDVFPLLIFVPIFVFVICLELVRVFQGELKSLVPILYDLGAISSIVTASYFFKDSVEAFSKNAIGLSLLCLLGAIFIGSGTFIRNGIARAKR